MTKEDLQDLYREWSDEKLLAAFNKKQDYTELAISAMITILDERKIGGGSQTLLEEAQKQEHENEIQTKYTLEQKQRMYEYDVLGEIISASDFAKKNRNERGEYYTRELVSNNYKVLRTVLIGLSVAGFLIAIMAVVTEAPLDYAYLYFGIPALIFLLIGIRLFKNSKAYFKLSQQGRKDIFYLLHDKYVFQATVPFKYFAFWTKITDDHGAIKISHPLLSVVITNKINESILIQGHLTPLQDAPPEWPENDNSCTPKGTQFFSQQGFKHIDLLRLKKILDGLHDIHADLHQTETSNQH